MITGIGVCGAFVVIVVIGFVLFTRFCPRAWNWFLDQILW